MGQGTKWIHRVKKLRAASFSVSLIGKGENRVIDAPHTLVRERAKIKGELFRALGGVTASVSILGVPLGHNSFCVQGPSFSPPCIREPIWCGSTNYSTEKETNSSGDSGALCCTANNDAVDTKRSFITFVLGGPGSGKGTQCARIASEFGFSHLSAGELLRGEMSSDSRNGDLIRGIIKEGKIVPSEITVNLIRKAIESITANKFLIDGFPRSEENRIAFERIIGVEPDLVLFFDCPEEEMVRRLLGRNQGRIDDNIETIKNRLKVFEKLNLPVISYYSAKGKVRKISATGTVDEIFEKVRHLFASLRLD